MAVRGNVHEAMRAHGAIVAEMPPGLSHRAETLLDFWFAPERETEDERLRDIWFQATPDSTLHSPRTFAPIAIAQRQEFTARGGPHRRPA